MYKHKNTMQMSYTFKSNMLNTEKFEQFTFKPADGARSLQALILLYRGENIAIGKSDSLQAGG